MGRLKMDYLTYILINAPLVLLNLVANAFFIFCMVRPLHGERIKQPLKLLLASLICCTMIYLVVSIEMVFSPFLPESVMVNQIYVAAISSMTSSVWLNFFFYTQIVPAQRALFIWIKKNIKSIIYFVWLVDRLYNAFDFTIMFMVSLPSIESSTNLTMGHDFRSSESWRIIFFIVICMVKVNFVVCLCVMVMSSGSTVVYLSGHMHRMAANGRSLSGPRFSAQVRVTVTGILQGFLYVFCAGWSMCMFFRQGDHIVISAYIHFTIINLYMSGTTLNLGAGQAVFRQRAAHIWFRATQCCKATQVQQSGPGG